MQGQQPLPRNMQPTRDKLESGKTYQLEFRFILGFIQYRNERIFTMAAEKRVLNWKKIKRTSVKFQLFLCHHSALCDTSSLQKKPNRKTKTKPPPKNPNKSKHTKTPIR